MPSSMTGMGKGAYHSSQFSVEVELKSVNHRYLVIKNHIPPVLLRYEQRLHETIRKQIRRGTVDLFIKIKMNGNHTTSRINKDVLEGYLKAIVKIRKREHLEGAITPELLLGLPGVLEAEENLGVPAKLLTVIEKTTKLATDRLARMRNTEGKRLIRDVLKYRRLIGKHLRIIRGKVKKNSKERNLRLKARIEEILSGKQLSANDPTLQREIAVLADRSDVTEELDRLNSHLVQFDKILGSNGEIGRQLDFLLQEMGREVNTIGSKACNASVSHDVVLIKSELEKIREQVQNIE